MKSSSSSPSQPAAAMPQDRYETPNETTTTTTTTTVPYVLTEEEGGEKDGLMRDDKNSSPDASASALGASYQQDDEEFQQHDDDDDESEGSEEEDVEYGMSLQELLYSTSSYHAIAKPVSLTMILSALAVVLINTDETRQEGQQAMANAYQVWNINNNASASATLAYSLANALIMVSVICAMTFVIVLLYRFRCMKCLIGYMMLCSGTLLGVLGGNILQTAISIYSIPVDKLTFYWFIFNFGIVGVISVFFGKGVPKYVTQGYLIATSVILAWHLSFFDDWTAWTLLLMLALYDLCAVLTPCGPLKALVNLMSEEEAPEMPGLLYEAELPPEAKRPGVPRNSTGLSQDSARSMQPPQAQEEGDAPAASPVASPSDEQGPVESTPAASAEPQEGPKVNVPLAIAKVYSLRVVAIPSNSMNIIYPQRYDSHSSSVSASPLLQSTDDGVGDSASTSSSITLPENPTPSQLRADVTVALPLHGGRIEQVSRSGKRVYLERDRHGNPKRILWVDRHGKVFAEIRGDDEESPLRNSIRLGLGDFIFYSVLVAKAAQYSFATFCACMLVILAGLGGTLVLLSVYHHALPALPISIFLGVVFYLVTRFLIEPWIEVVLHQPFYV